MIQGFREFIMKGNVVDLAVAVVIGAAFGALITSFVADILTPLLGLLGVPDFRDVVTTLPSGATINSPARMVICRPSSRKTPSPSST